MKLTVEVMRGFIQHPGSVSAIKDGRMQISLSETGGCSACHRSLCVLGEAGPRQVDVPLSREPFRVGDPVLVQIAPSAGYAALFWLYLFPFLLMIAALGGMMAWQHNEAWAGLAALVILFPYYFLLYVSRRNWRKPCEFTVLKNE